MKRFFTFAALAAVSLSAASPVAAQRYDSRAQDEEARFDAARRRFDSEYQAFQAAIDRYRDFQASRRDWRPAPPPPPPPPRVGANYDDPNYDPARYYRDGSQYHERVLATDDRVYRGSDGRYYCRRNDGTTGLIVGAAAGGLFGNVVAGNGSRTVGTLLGAIAGGALGTAIDRNNSEIRCR